MKKFLLKVSSQTPAGLNNQPACTVQKGTFPASGIHDPTFPIDISRLEKYCSFPVPSNRRVVGKIRNPRHHSGFSLISNLLKLQPQPFNQYTVIHSNHIRSNRVQQQQQTMPPTVDIVTPKQVLSRGLDLVNFGPDRQRNVRYEKNLTRFKEFFGAAPLVYSIIWHDLQTHSIVNVEEENTKIEDLLVAIYFLKVYPKESQAEGCVNLSDNTIRKWVWIYIQKLVELLPVKINWPKAWNPDEDPSKKSTIFILTVDGVHCPIWEPMHAVYSKNPEFYSHKYHKAGLNYEIAMSIFEQRCVWINGPFPAGSNDISVFNSQLKQKMLSDAPGKRGIADRGYPGTKGLLSNPSSHDSAAVRAFKSRALARHEKFKSKMIRDQFQP